MTLTEAKEEIRIRGVPLADVYERVEEHNREELKRWFVHATGVPNVVARKAAEPVFSGRACDVCGGMLIRTGTCETCQSCGHNEGCG